MKRNPALLLVVGAGAFLANSCAPKVEYKTDVNILWLFGEDISPWMPAYGDNTVQTPNIDFLAENGVLYTNCYSSCPVSSPARSAIMTGMWQTSINAHNHRSGRTTEYTKTLPEGMKVVSQMFLDAGYHAYSDGKDDFNWQYDWNDYWIGTYVANPAQGSVGHGSYLDRKEGQLFFGVVELFGGKNHNKVEHPVKLEDVPVPSYYPDNEIIRAERARHYNQIMLTDIEIGSAIEELKKNGLYENTIIVFMSDNGYRAMRDKQFCYDGGIHMPFVISAPGNPDLLAQYGIEIGSKCDDMISLMDVTATSLNLAGIEIPKYMESMDIFDKDFHRDYIVAARDRCDFTIDRIRAIRTKEFKYIRNFMTDRPLMQPQYRDKQAPFKMLCEAFDDPNCKFEKAWLDREGERPAEELYDIVNDPDEVHNLATDPKYAADLKKMRGYLEEWIETTGDQGQYPECEEELRYTYEFWGDRCVNPEYDVVKSDF